MPAPWTLRELALFVALAEERSFRMAARRLGRVPSSVTEAAQRLEQKSAQRLFDRTSSTVQLTRAGRMLLPAAREILLANGRFQLAAEHLGLERRTVRFGVGRDVPHQQVNEVLTTAQTIAADANVEAIIGTTDHHVDLLARGLLDCAVLRAPLRRRGIRLTMVHRGKLDHVVLRAGHPLAARPLLTPGDVDRETWMRPQRRIHAELHDSLTSWWDAHVARIRAEDVDADFHGLDKMVNLNGWFYLCSAAQASEARAAGNVAVPFCPAPPMEVVLAFATDAAPVVRALAEASAPA